MAVNRILRRFGLELKRHKPKRHMQRVTIEAEGGKRGTALVAYIVEPFLGDGKSVNNSHTNHIESVMIVRALTQLGFEVDVIDYRNANFVPEKPYNLFISARTHFARVAQRLNGDCIKIAHLDTAHFLFNNASAYRRLQELKDRRGAATHSLKRIEENWAPETADYLAILGNDFTLGTYAYANKPMYPLLVPTPYRYDSPVDKDFTEIARTFLWFGSGGLAHKGLDLVLEAFAELPDFKLIVCGPVEAHYERQFVTAYDNELFHQDNIETIGWVDVSSAEFRDLARRCIGLVYPSASEGQSGAVVTCMQAGLIPIVSRESGVDVHDFGSVLPDCRLDTLRDVIVRLSEETPESLKRRAVESWEYARSNHTTDVYLAEYRRMIESVLDRQSK